MAKSTSKINFYCNKAKASKKTGEAPIYLSIIINGQRELFPLPLKCKPEDFNKLMESKKDNPVKLYCSTVIVKLEELKLDMLKMGKELTASNLKDFFERGCVLKVYTISDLFTEYLKILYNRVGKDLTLGVYQKYENAFKYFNEANELTGKESVRELSNKHIVTVTTYLQDKFKESTAAGYLQKLRTVFLFAFNEGKMEKYLFGGVKIMKCTEETIEYLTEEELKVMTNTRMPTRSLEHSRDVFLFQCYTGLAYADVAALKPTDFQPTPDGYYIINKRRIKTKVEYTAVLLGDATYIVNKYKFNLPVISNQKYNVNLKAIAEICELVENDGSYKQLHSHIARHTYAMYLLNHRDPVIPNETIIRALGWTNDKMLRHYAKLKKSTVISDIKKMETENDKLKRDFSQIIFGDNE